MFPFRFTQRETNDSFHPLRISVKMKIKIKLVQNKVCPKIIHFMVKTVLGIFWPIYKVVEFFCLKLYMFYYIIIVMIDKQKLFYH